MTIKPMTVTQVFEESVESQAIQNCNAKGGICERVFKQDAIIY